MFKHFLVIALILLTAFSLTGCKFGGQGGGGNNPPKTGAKAKKILFSSVPAVSADEATTPSVISALPYGNVVSEDDGKAITVVFSTPMVPLSPSTDKADCASWFTISPAIKGEYRWIGTSTVTFIPEKPLEPGKKYKVTISGDVKSVSDKTLGQEYVWSFSYLPPFVEKSYPNNSTNLGVNSSKIFPVNKPIALLFNQKISTDELQKKLTFIKDEKNGESVNFSVKSPSAKTDLPDENWDMSKTLLVVPSNSLEQHTKYKINIKDLTAGELSMSNEYSLNFVTESKFAFNGLTSEKPIPDSDLYLQFSNPVRQKDLVKNISFSPEVKVPESEVEYASQPASIYGLHLKPDTEYKMTLKGDLADVNGNKLGKDISTTFRTGDFSPSYSIQGRECVLHTTQNPAFPITVLNVPQVVTTVKRMSKDDIIAYKNDSYYSAERVRKLAEQDPAYVRDTFDTNCKKNIKSNFLLPLDKYLSAEEKTGVLFIDVTEPKNINNSDNSLVQFTNLSIHTKVSPENGFVWVTHAITAESLKDIDIEIRNYNSKVLWTGKTDENGCFFFYDVKEKIKDIDDKTLYVFASKGFDLAFISTDYSWNVALWDLDGMNCDSYRYSNPYKALFFTERGLYKPGDKVSVKGIVREKTDNGFKFPKEDNFFIELNDSRGQKIFQKDLKKSEMGSFNFDIQLSSDVASGPCFGSVYQKIDNPKNENDRIYIGSLNFNIQEYKPADLSSEVIAKKKEIFGEGTAEVDVKTSWLFGAPLQNGSLNWVLTASPTYFVPQGCEEYSFGSRDLLGFEDNDFVNRLASGEDKLDENGKKTLKSTFDVAKLPQDANLTFEATSKASKTQISSSASIIWHKSEIFPGLKPESFIGFADKEFNIKAACFDSKGKAYSSRPMKLNILKREWNSVRKTSIDGGTSWVCEKKDTPVTELTANGSEYEFKFTPKNSGYYVAKLTVSDKKNVEAVSETGFYVSGSDSFGWLQSDSNAFKLNSDKKNYKPGDTAKVFIPSPYKSAKALITIERNGVTFKQIIKIDGSNAVVQIPVESGNIPGIYVSALILPIYNSPDEVLESTFRVGYAKLPVVADSNKIAVEIKPDKKDYKPGEKVNVTLKVKDSSGKPVKGEVTLAVVDEGVLSLTGYRLPNLFENFYDEITLCVNTFDANCNFVDLASYAEKGNNGGGGSDEMSNLSNLRKNFKDTAYWNPSIMTDSNGEATISFELPDNLTSFRIMADACNEQSFSNMASEMITVSKPIVVKAAVPFFAHIGDEMLCGVSVVNNSKSNAKVTTKMTQNDMELLDSSESKTVSIPAGAEMPILFKLKAIKNVNASFYFVTDADGEHDELKAVIPVIPSNTGIQTEFLSGVTNGASAHEKIDISGEIVPESVRLKVFAGSCGYDQLKDSFNYLKNYKYDCLEQTTSKIFPYADAPEFVRFIGEGRNEADVQKWLKTAESRQVSDGGFALWEGTNKSSEYLSCYVMHAIGGLNKQGVSVPQDMINSGKNYIGRLAKRAMDDKSWSDGISDKEKYFIKAYALYDLYLLKSNDDASLNVLFEKSENIGINAQSMLLKAMHLKGASYYDEDTLKDRIMNKIRIEGKNAWFEADGCSIPYTYSSDVSTTSLAFSALTEVYKNFPESDKVLHWLNSKRPNGMWSNTHENALAISAVSRAIAIGGDDSNRDFQASVRLGDSEIAKGMISARGSSGVSAEVPLNEIGNKVDLTFEKNSSGNMYYSADLTWQPKGTMESVNKGFSVLKIIEPVDGKKSSDFTEGTVYKVTVSVSSQYDRHFVMLEDAVPAGFEVIKTGFETESSYYAQVLASIRNQQAKKNGWKTFDHQEYYNDRVISFATNMSKGEHLFTYLVRANYKGKYSMFPAKAFLMYSPEVYGSSNSSEIEIK